VKSFQDTTQGFGSRHFYVRRLRDAKIGAVGEFGIEYGEQSGAASQTTIDHSPL
jgi:hypothetical protein